MPGRPELAALLAQQGQGQQNPMPPPGAPPPPPGAPPGIPPEILQLAQQLGISVEELIQMMQGAGPGAQAGATIPPPVGGALPPRM